MAPSPDPDHWLPCFNFNVEEWFEGDRYETLAICRTLEAARAAFAAAVAEKPDGRFMIRFPAFYTDHVDRRLAACAWQASTESFSRVDGTSFLSCFPAEIVARFHGNGFETPKSPACEASSLCRNAD